MTTRHSARRQGLISAPESPCRRLEVCASGECQFIKGKNMSKAVSLALLAGGIVLIVFGVMASPSFPSDISRFFTGSPTDKAIWMLLGGVVASIVGVVGLVRG